MQVPPTEIPAQSNPLAIARAERLPGCPILRALAKGGRLPTSRYPAPALESREWIESALSLRLCPEHPTNAPPEPPRPEPHQASAPSPAFHPARTAIPS